MLFFVKERDEKLRTNRVIGRVLEQVNNQGMYIHMYTFVQRNVYFY